MITNTYENINYNNHNKSNTNNSSLPLWYYRCANISPKALEILPKKKHSQKAVNTYCCNDLPDDMTNYFNY